MSWFDAFLDKISATSPNVKCSIPVALPKEDTVTLSATTLEWLKSSLDLGHIEPSQVAISRLLHWPLRKHLRSSLYVDYELWMQRQYPKQSADHKSEFYKVCDKVFVRNEDYYDFPPLEECRDKFRSLIHGS